jgi:hypothetical protein
VLEGRLFGVAVNSTSRLINVTAVQADPRPENLGAFTQMNVVQQIGVVVQLPGSLEFTPLGEW